MTTRPQSTRRDARKVDRVAVIDLDVPAERSPGRRRRGPAVLLTCAVDYEWVNSSYELAGRRVVRLRDGRLEVVSAG